MIRRLLSFGLTGDVTMMRSSGQAMNVAATWIIVPLSLASPATGLLLGAATRSGLFKRYWVLFKGLMTLPSTVAESREIRLIEVGTFA